MRVDFSGRGPVALAPELRLDQCRLPERMALELYRLHLSGELVRQGLARTPEAARRLIEAQPALVRPVLEALSAEHPVILSAAGARSRHGLQAFFPLLWREDAIALSPLALARLAGDDGALALSVFLPLGDNAQQEACQRLTSPATLVAPEARRPRVDLSRDARAGLYLASLARTGARGRAPLPAPRAAWKALEPGASLAPRAPALRRLVEAQLARWGSVRGLFASLGEVELALSTGELSPNAHVFVRHRGATLSTVAGRCLVMALLPAEVPALLVNRPLDRKALDALFEAAVLAVGLAQVATLAEGLEALGSRLVTKAGLSLGADDLRGPAQKAEIVARARDQIAMVHGWYDDGQITDGERYGKILDVWAQAAAELDDRLAQDQRGVGAVDPETGELALDPPTSPLALLRDGGVAGGKKELAALSAMKGAVAKPSTEIFEQPIVASLREGLSPHDLFMAALSARGEQVRRRKRRQEDDWLAEVLVHALGRMRIVAEDCGALGALPMRELDDGGYPVVSLEDRVRGRVHAEPGEILAGVAEGEGEIPVRSPAFCEAEGGLCARCYGRFPGNAFPEIGERVGLHAAHALASSLDQVRTWRFHIGSWCGVSMRQASTSEAPIDGVLVLRPADAVLAESAGRLVLLGRSVELWVRAPDGTETPSGGLPYGGVLTHGPGTEVQRGEQLAEWDRDHRPLLAHHDGVVRWVDLVDGRTYRVAVDEVTGLPRTEVLADEAEALHPAIEIVSEGGRVLQTHRLDAGTLLELADGARVARGDLVGKQRLAIWRWFDWRGRDALDRLLHAKTRRPAVRSEIRGITRFEAGDDGSLTVVVRPMLDPPEDAARWSRRYRFARPRDVCVREGEVVEPGQALDLGDDDPRDDVRIFGPVEGARSILDRLQMVYAYSGVALDARHAEIAARALLAWVRITAPGEGPWEEGALVPRAAFDLRCRALSAEGRVPPRGEPTMRGLAHRR